MKTAEFSFYVRVVSRRNGVVSNTAFHFTHKKPAWDFAIELAKLWGSNYVKAKDDDKMIVSVVKESLDESPHSTTLFTQVCN